MAAIITIILFLLNLINSLSHSQLSYLRLLKYFHCEPESDSINGDGGDSFTKKFIIIIIIIIGVDLITFIFPLNLLII